MRIVLLSALLLTAAACVQPPPVPLAAAPPPSAAVGAPVPLMPPSAAPPVSAPAPALAPAPAAASAATAPPPAPAAPVSVPAVVAAAPPSPPAVVPAVFAPIPFAQYFTPWAGRLELSNFSYGLTDVEAIVTPYPDCVLHPGIVPLDFKLPLNGTWVIPASPGMDVCWRREIAAEGQSPQSHQWTEWNRAFTSSGRLIDSRL